MKPASLSRITLTCLVLLSAVFSTSAPTVHAQSDRVTFAVIGDFGQAGQPLADVSNLIKGWIPDFIVTVGDNNYPGGQSYSIDDNIGQYFHDYIFQYKGKYGNSSPSRRFYPSLGNHDWGTTDAKPYLDFFGVARYYDFVQGPIHFFMLDSDRNEPDGTTADSQQGIWLRKGLAASTSRFNVVVLHHAPYSSGRHGSSEYMRWPFKEWGADVVLAGHDHTYERLMVNGLPYFVNGVGGSELYNFVTVLPESQVRFNQDFGAMRVEATSTYIKFQLFTRTGVLVDDYVLGENAPFVKAITRLNPSPTNEGTVNFQVTFSAPVSGVDAADFLFTTNLNGIAIASVNGSGNSYIVTVNTGSGDGTLRLDLADDDSIISSLGVPLGWSGIGNGNFPSGETYLVDKTPPSVLSITPVSLNPTNAPSMDLAITFSEPVSGVDVSDFSLNTNSGATLTNLTGSAANYTATVSNGNGNDSVRLDFQGNDSVMDLAGNVTTAGYTGGIPYIVDRTAPTVLSITPLYRAETLSVEYSISFSEPVTGLDGGDFFLSTMNGAAITNIIGSGSQYVVSVSTQPGSDSIRLDVIDNDSITDGVSNPLGGAGMGNGNFMGGIFNLAIETPIVTSIIRASNNPTNAANVDFIVTFSEPVDGVDVADFVVTGGAFIANIRNVNPFFIVTVTTGTGEGELKMDLIDDDSIHNPQGITLGGRGAGNGNFTAGGAFTIDRTPPQVTSITRAGGNPTINPAADFIVTFSEPVFGVDMNDFTVTQSNIIQSSVVSLQNVNPFYWVTVNTGAGSGTIRLDMFDNGNITDRAGNPLPNGIYTLGESFIVAKTTIDFPEPIINEIPKALTNNPFALPSWSPVRSTQAYEFFIARDNRFSQIVFSQTILGTSMSLPAPLLDGTYYMRVRAYNPELNPGRFSKTYAFTVDATPPIAPRLVSPKNNSATPRRPWLQWSRAGDAIKYQLEVDNNADFSSPEFSAGTAKTTLQIKNLLARPYFWRVRAMDSAGNWSAWSTVFNFQVR